MILGGFFGNSVSGATWVAALICCRSSLCTLKPMIPLRTSLKKSKKPQAKTLLFIKCVTSVPGASVARFRPLGGLPQRSLFPYRFSYRSATSGPGGSVARFRHLGGLLQRSHFPYSFLYRSAIFGGRRLCGQISASGGPSPEEPFSLHISLQIGHFGARRLCGQISASGRPSPEEPLSLQLSLQIGHFRARRLCGQIWLNAYFHPCTTRCETVASALVSAVEQSVLA